jgi:rod shape-determining protein MreD
MGFFILAFIGGILLTVAESIFMQVFDTAWFRPDLTVLVIVVATCRLSFGRVMAAAFAMGLARDLFSGGIVGMSAFALPLTAYVLITAADYLLTDNWRGQMFVAFLGSTLYGSQLALLKVITGFTLASGFGVMEIIVGTAACTAILSPLGFALSAGRERESYTHLKKKYDVDDEIIHQAEV